MHMTAYAYIYSFDPLTFFSKSMITWLNYTFKLSECALLIRIQRLDQNSVFEQLVQNCNSIICSLVFEEKHQKCTCMHMPSCVWPPSNTLLEPKIVPLVLTWPEINPRMSHFWLAPIKFTTELNSNIYQLQAKRFMVASSFFFIWKTMDLIIEQT